MIYFNFYIDAPLISSPKASDYSKVMMSNDKLAFNCGNFKYIRLNYPLIMPIKDFNCFSSLLISITLYY